MTGSTRLDRSVGRLFGVGMGPGDPDYLTLRAFRALQDADLLVHFCKRGVRGNARTIADAATDDPIAVRERSGNALDPTGITANRT